jgi:hypothetical protein
VSTLEAEGVDVGAERLGDPQPVERQHRDEGVVAGTGEPRGHEDGAELVAVKASCV